MNETRLSTRERLRTWRREVRPAVPRPGESFPPGPRSPGLVQTLGVWGRRNTYIPALRKRFGDTFLVRVAPVGDIVFLCDPQDVRTVTLGGPDTFPVGEQNAMFEPLLGRRTVLALDGTEHLAERKRMMPAFHGRRIAGVVPITEQLTAQEVATWPVGETFPLIERMRALTLKVIVRVIMGADEGEEADRLRAALRPTVNIRTLDLFMWMWPQLTRIGPWRRAVEALDHADELLYEQIQRRRRDPERQQRPDMLSMLVDGSPDDELVWAELVTLLLGGFETTAVAAAWMFERLLRHPRVLARVRAGLDDPKDEYRTAVVKETLRLRQVSYNVGRRLTKPVELGGYRLPAGTYVWPSLAAIHTDRRVWGADAELFRPERWLEADAPARSFLPFGGGAHRCLGAAFAQMEMETFLRVVPRLVDLEPDRMADEPAAMRNIIQVPTRGARVRVTRRRRQS